MLLAMACSGVVVLLGSRGQLSRLLPSPIIRALLAIGNRSYTIYLLHFPCMLLAWILLVSLRPAWTMNAWLFALTQPIATALFLIPLTELSYRSVELPWNATGHAIAGGARPSRLAVS